MIRSPLPRMPGTAALLVLCSLAMPVHAQETSRVGDALSRQGVTPIGQGAGLGRPVMPNAPEPGATAPPSGPGGPRVTPAGTGTTPSPQAGASGNQGTESAFAIPQPARTWGELVQGARTRLAGAGDDERRKALTGRAPEDVFAALELVARGQLEAEDALLIRLLEATRSRPVARALVVLLAARPSDPARKAIEDHVERRGVADDTGIRYLWARPSARSRSILVQRASLATARDPASLLAIRALATDSSLATTHLLARLAEERSEAVRVEAQAALAVRAKAGLPTDTPMKPIEYGESYEEILADQPEVTDVVRFYQRAASGQASGARSSGGKDQAQKSAPAGGGRSGSRRRSNPEDDYD